MPQINATSKFMEYKQTSKPVYELPKSTKEALQIDEVFKDGTFRVEPQADDALYDRCYIFEDINYITKDFDERNHVLHVLMDYFKSMTSQQKFFIASEQMDLNEFVSEIFKPVNKEQYPEFADEIGRFIYQKIEEGNKDINRTLYLVCTVRADSYESAKLYFNTLEVDFENLFPMLGSSIYKLGAIERLSLIQRIFNLNQSVVPLDERYTGNDAWRTVISPMAIDSSQGSDFLQIEKRYCCTLCAMNYDRKIDDEKVIYNLADNNFPVYLTIDLEPIPRKLLVDRLETAHSNNEAQMAKERDRNNRNNQWGVGPSYKTQHKNDDLELLLEKIDANDEICLYIGFLCMTYADSYDELLSQTDILIRKATDAGYVLKPIFHQQIKALNTVLPIGGRHVNNMRTFLSSSATCFNPFRSKDIKDEGGAIIGINTQTKQLIRINRKKLKSPHAIVVGHTGGGKSMFVKVVEVIQTLLLTDDDIIVIDPQNEFQKLCIEHGGSYFDLTPQCEIYLNPFEVPQYICDMDDDIERNKFIAAQSDYANSFVSATIKSNEYNSDYEDVVYDAVHSMYREYFANGDYSYQPTLITLTEYLTKLAEATSIRFEKQQAVFKILDALKKYTEGVYNMFSKESTVKIDNRFIGFGIKKIPTDAWEPVMVTVMHFVSQRMEYNQNRNVAGHLIVDETQVLCNKGRSAQQLLYAIETYRKVGGIVTLIIQNLKRALENPDLRDMFSNCPFKVFFDQGGIDAQALAEIQTFSSMEYKALTEATAGKGVLCKEDEVIIFDAVIDKNNPLYDRISTNFHEQSTADAPAENYGTV